jgi:hypothetical protein
MKAVPLSETHKHVLHAANSAIAKGNYEGFLAHCKDMVRQWMAETYQEPPVFEVKQLIGEGDWLTALGEITSTDDAGNEVSYSYCDVWRFEGDKLAELRAFVIRPTIPE